MMFEIALQRLVDDFVVTMILALIPKRAFPGVTILELGVPNDFRHALPEWNGDTSWHLEEKNDRIDEGEHPI
jgi:hypothetical protein